VALFGTDVVHETGDAFVELSGLLTAGHATHPRRSAGKSWTRRLATAYSVAEVTNAQF